jgi:hypothetical protein
MITERCTFHRAAAPDSRCTSRADFKIMPLGIHRNTAKRPIALCFDHFMRVMGDTATYGPEDFDTLQLDRSAHRRPLPTRPDAT